MIYLRTSVGVEIRDGDLLLSSLQSNLSGGVFTQFKRISDFGSRPRDEVRREVDSFFKAKRLSRDKILLGLPRAEVIVRHLDLPKEVEDNLKQVVLYQVQSFEPTEEDKFYYDYALLKAPQNAKRLVGLLVMIKKSILDDYLNLMRELGIRPAAVTMGSAALAGMFLRSLGPSAGKTFILANLRASGVEILALRKGFLVYTRETGKAEGANWKDLLLHEVGVAAESIRLGPEDLIEKIILAGDGSESARQEVQSAIEECELIGDTLRFEMPLENRPHLQEAATSLGLAYCGLVRRPPIKLNLLPSELRVRRTAWAYIPALALGLGIVALLVALGFHAMIQEQVLVRKLDREMLGLKSGIDRVQVVRTQSEALEKRVDFFEGILRQRDMNLEILQELTTILPADAFLSLYGYKDGTIIIAGSSSAPPDLIPKLEGSPLLKNVVQRGTIFKDAQTGKDRFTFDMKVER